MPQLSKQATAGLMIAALGTKTIAIAAETLGSLVTVSEARVLYRLMDIHEGGPVPTTSLLGLPGTGEITTTPALSRVVRALEEQGFVTRTASTADRRHMLVEVTPAGMEVWQAMLVVFETASGTTYGDLTDADLTTLIDILTKLGPNLPEWPASQQP